MRIFFGILFFCSVIFASNEVVPWKENVFIENGWYHVAYKCQVFKTKHSSTAPAFLYCEGKSQNHDYQYPSPQLFHVIGYTVTGYKDEENGVDEKVDFSLFKNSFERYCYLPCDGMSSFYNRHPLLKKTFSYIPFLNVLIPYWIEGDMVQEIAVDTITRWLKTTDSFSSNMFPDIPINISYSDNDPIVSKEDARVLCHQLIKTGTFTNVRLVRVENDDDTFMIHDESLNEEDLQFENTVKSYENRQWWLKNLWISKLGLILVLIPIVLKLATHYQSKVIWGLGCLAFEEIMRR